jgi:hypothetical protein
MAVANTQAYNPMATITTVKSFIVLALGIKNYNYLFIVSML